MRAQVLIENSTRRTWLYIPEVHIQVQALKSGEGKWVVAAFRTDGYFGRIPAAEHLARNYRVLHEVDVPDFVAIFAVDSERQRQEEVEEIEAISLAVGHKDPRTIFEDLFSVFAASKVEHDYDEDLEQRVGDVIDRLLTEGT